MTWLRRGALYLLIAFLGFAVGCVSIFVVWLRGRPPLDLWHTVELEAEYHVDGPNAVESFSDYLALEERLFAELDERVYAHTPTGPDRGAFAAVLATPKLVTVAVATALDQSIAAASCAALRTRSPFIAREVVHVGLPSRGKTG